VNERGSGSVLAVAIGAAVAAVTALALPLYMGLALKQSVSAAADAAALAAADTVIGIVAGYPCETAARVAAANGSGLAACQVDGFIVTVSATRLIVGVAVTSTATAGPPPGGAD